MYSFNPINKNNLSDDVIEKFESSELYHTSGWINYLKKELNIEPIYLEIYCDKKKIGYFIGGLFKKFGVKIVGSPFRGWDTPYLGLLVESNYNKIEILKELWKYLKSIYKCLYFEFVDKSISLDDIKLHNLNYIIEKTYEMSISLSDDELLNSFTKHCRKDLKLFRNRGGIIKKVDYNESFLDDFYECLVEVFKFQKLNPPYSKEKLKTIIESVSDENRLCLISYNSENFNIGMSVSFGYKDKCYAFASGTNRSYNLNQKNALRFEAIKYWRDCEKKRYDLMGIREYKKEFNPDEISYYRIVFTKYKFLIMFRNMAKKIYWKINRIKFKFTK